MNYEEYGIVIGKLDIENGIQYIVKSDTRIFTIEKYATYNKVRIEGSSDFTWTDTKIDDTTFMRELGKNVLYIRDGEVLVRSKELNAKPFRKLSKLGTSDEFMTMDIETVNVKCVHI